MNRAWMLAVSLAIGTVVGLSGCKGTEADKLKRLTRSQSSDDPTELDGSTTVGSKTTIGNTEAIEISGVGLVYGLPGTGSSAQPGGWRLMLEDALKKQGVDKPKQILDDPNRTTSLVLVSALVPPGARKGDLIDIHVTLPDDSKTTSLKGGKLYLCELYNTDSTGNIKSIMQDSKPSGPGGSILKGDVWAKAEGALIAGQFVPTNKKVDPLELDADGLPVFKVGRIWGGGKIVKPRSYYVQIAPGSQSGTMAYSIAERINSTFHATSEPNLKVADAKNRETILVNVPMAYRNNHYRFLLVARQVPLLQAGADSVYRKKLEDELLDPATTLIAAVKLEALGTSSMKSLRVGLESTSPWVRFASAESLTYLGQTDGAAELARLAEDHPALRAPALKALAAMDDAACTDRLAELMANAEPTLRYGAFLALRLADENNPAARGMLINNSYWLHQVAPGSPPVIHLTSERRCEVVLFGDAPKLRGPFTLPVGSEFSVRIPSSGAEATVTRIVKVKNGNVENLEEKSLVCKTDLAAVLMAIGRLGGGHSEAIELIKRADKAQVLSATVVVDAIPAELNIRQLAQFARTDSTLTRVNVEVARAGVIGADLDLYGFDLPPPPVDPATQFTPPPPPPPLSRRGGGRIFGPKQHETPAIDPGVLPAGQ